MSIGGYVFLFVVVLAISVISSRIYHSRIDYDDLIQEVMLDPLEWFYSASNKERREYMRNIPGLKKLLEKRWEAQEEELRAKAAPVLAEHLPPDMSVVNPFAIAKLVRGEELAPVPPPGGIAHEAYASRSSTTMLKRVRPACPYCDTPYPAEWFRPEIERGVFVHAMTVSMSPPLELGPRYDGYKKEVDTTECGSCGAPVKVEFLL